MFRRVLLKCRNSAITRVFLLTALSALVLVSGRGLLPETDGSAQTALRKPSGSPQLVSIEPLPAMDGEMCVWEPASANFSFAAALQEDLQRDRAGQASSGGSGNRPVVDADRAPVRVLRDTYPTYSAVTLDLANNELILQDENLFQILVYDRTANTPPTATMTEPKRVIGGRETKVEFNCGLYVDPKTGDIYSVANDTIDTLTIFSREARGNVPPTRELRTPHGTFGITVDEAREEMYLTVQHTNSVVVYRKMAQGEEKPLRTIQGAATQLEDPHGIALDPKNGWIFVTNHGHARDHSSPARLVEHPLQIVDRECRPARRQRHERDVAERLHAVARVHVQVAFRLHDRSARTAGQRANRQLVGERAGRHEHCPLLAQDARELGLQLVHDATEDVVVGRDATLLDEARQETAVLPRREA